MSETAVSARRVWAAACTRVAWIAGVFSLVTGVLLLVNSFGIYQGAGGGKVRVVEAAELEPLKAALREDPNNEALKQQVREMDQQMRYDYFRREMLATRGGWSLVGGAVVFLVALQLGRHLRRPRIPAPQLSGRPEDPVRNSMVAARAVAGTAVGLAGLTMALVWNTSPQWQGMAVRVDEVAADAPVESAGVADDWFPGEDELAANWWRFRGPDGSGVHDDDTLPQTWDAETGKNLRWKTEIDLPGESSPVLWGNRIYLTGATEKERAVYAFDADSGGLLWKKPVGTPQSARAEVPEVLEDTGFAAPTAATDGRRVFAIFANGDVAGFSADGEELWVRSLGTPENMYGHAASLTLWRNRVIVVVDQADAEAGKSRIMALDAASGKPVWSTARPVANSWVSPVIIKHKGREQIITSADPWVISYDPETGGELWKAECMMGDVAPSPVYQNDLLYLACDQTAVLAINPDGSGNVTDSNIVWMHEEDGLPDMCSLLCDGPRVYTLVFGVLYAFDAMSGKQLWEYETEAKFEASPGLVNGRLELLTTDGEMIFGEAGNEGFKETGRAAIGEEVGASPAFSPGRIYLRGDKHLFCIEKQDGE